MRKRILLYALALGLLSTPLSADDEKRRPSASAVSRDAAEISKQAQDAITDLFVKKDVIYQYWGPTPVAAGADILRRVDPSILDALPERTPVERGPAIIDDAATRAPTIPRARPEEYEAQEILPATKLTAELAAAIGRTITPTPITQQSPAPALTFTPPVSGVDPMVAAGEDYLVVTQDHRIAFYDKQGNPLKDKNGNDHNFSATSFFGKFIAPKNADGSTNLDNINRYLNFPSDAPISCDLTDETPDFPCVGEFYDTRVLYDPFHKRFVILSAARHSLWTSDPDYGELARRFIAIAVSKGEDPRDGFHQYMPTWSNYRDWPWMAVNGDYLVTAKKGATDPEGPVASVFHLPSMMTGSQNPPFFKYFEGAIGGGGALIPAMHYPGESNLTFMLKRGKGGTRTIYAFAPPSDPWTAPPLMSASVPITAGVGSIRDSVTYRKGKLSYVSARSLGEFGLAVQVVRIPVSATAGGISASSDPADGFFDNIITIDADPSLEHRVSREVMSSAVNADGDMLIAYGRYSMEGEPAILGEVRYSVWYHDDAFPRWSRRLKQGVAQPTENGEPVSYYSSPVDYSAVVVDPADGKSFWIAHEYGATTAKNGYKIVIGKVTP